MRALTRAIWAAVEPGLSCKPRAVRISPVDWGSVDMPGIVPHCLGFARETRPAYNGGMSQDIWLWLRRFLEYLEIEKGRSLATITMYERYLTRFLTQAGVSSPRELTPERVREFRLFLNRVQTRTGTMKKVTQNKYLIALRSFLKYLAINDVETLPSAKIELARAPERELDVITPEEFKRLMAAPSGESFEDVRDRAILEMLYSTGLRVSELCSLNEDLDVEARECSIRGKGEKLRLVFISEAAREAVKVYQREKARQSFSRLEPALFVMKSGGRIHPRAVQRLLEKRSRQAGIVPSVSPHGIRHYFATNLLHNGADIRSVQMLLGHTSINTTQAYTKLSDKFLREVHETFHGRGEKGSL